VGLVILEKDAVSLEVVVVNVPKRCYCHNFYKPREIIIIDYGSASWKDFKALVEGDWDPLRTVFVHF